MASIHHTDNLLSRPRPLYIKRGRELVQRVIAIPLLLVAVTMMIIRPDLFEPDE